jgi:hypothetical protein
MQQLGEVWSRFEQVWDALRLEVAAQFRKALEALHQTLERLLGRVSSTLDDHAPEDET